MADQASFRICSRCVMDTSDTGITFDVEGVCCHCHRFDLEIRPQILSPRARAEGLRELIARVKREGQGRKYDCLIGLSGGVDSSYVVYLARKHDLRSIVVHFDNGWDSELAVKNIENIIKKTGFDYFNYIVDWEEFRDLQKSYFKASVVDVEVPTDMGIFSLIPKLAMKFRVKNILFGNNIETESTMGLGWNFDKRDRSNLEDIHKRFGSVPLKTFPYYSPIQRLVYRWRDVRLNNILLYDECDYDKMKAVLREEMDWRDYGVKHGESVFTKFYQSYFLPRKFKFDKRRAHLSDRINSGHLTRDQALEFLAKPVYESADQEKQEFEYVISKLGFTEEEFKAIIRAPPRPHTDFITKGLYGSVIDRFVLLLLRLRRRLLRTHAE
jgi:N-acetyl sugar amidotransferase